jgi:PAS domain S-box-containing protein
LHSYISDRKQAEEALRLSQERYRSLVESLPQLVCMADVDGITEYCNQSWMNYTGLTLEQTQSSGWQQALAAGFQMHIPKSVEPKKLVRAIVNLVTRS